MDRYRLKNLIILILVLMDLSLLASLALRETARQSARRTATEQLVSLLAADGITLDPAVISSETPPAGRVLTQDDTLERRVAAELLGNHLAASDQGGGVTSYSSDRGAAMFRSGGFEAVGTLVSENAESFCRSFCKEFGYETPVFQLDESGSGTAAAARLCGGYPVRNCSVTFTITEGALTSVSGTLLPDGYTETTAETLSAAAALTAFQRMMQETIAVASSVTEMSCCFTLQTSASVPMSLIPTWRIVTDTDTYYVNCYTGVVSSS